MPDTTAPGTASFIPFNPLNSAAAAASVSPQGFDFGQFAQQLAAQAAQALPGLILGLLSTHPTVGPQVRAQLAPQSFNIGINTPLGGAGFSPAGAMPEIAPQGFDLGQLAQQIAGAILPSLPGLILGALSANPMVRTPLTPLAAAPGGVAPQGFDFGQFAQQLAAQAAQALPGLILGLLSAHPTVGPQLRAQLAPQSFNIGINTPFGGGGISVSGAAPSVAPQGLDLGTIAHAVAPLLPGLILSVLSSNPALSQQLRSSTIH